MLDRVKYESQQADASKDDGAASVAPVREKMIGKEVLRVEDLRLLRGDGCYVDDDQPGRQLEMAVARCPFPHARIVSIDVSEAFLLPGVHHILCPQDVREQSEPLTVLRPVPGAPALPYYALAQDRALHEGQPVVSVVASSRAIAEDALELIDIEYEPLPSVTDTARTLDPDVPLLHPESLKTNLLAENVDQAGDAFGQLERAEVVIQDRFRINRVTPLPMETRGILAHWRPGARKLTVRMSTQTPHLVRKQLAEILRMEESCIEVSASDVGGGFGMKLGAYPEDILAALHAMALRRPVKWIEDRLEHFRSATHGRESLHDYQIGSTKDGRFVAVVDDYVTDLGGWNSSFGSSQLSSVTFVGPYKVPDAYVRRRVALTNKTPVGAYRGYGQPEVNFAREVLVDRLARKLKMDPIELRRKNMLQPADLPWKTPSGAVYDNGDYPLSLEMAVKAIDYEAHRARASNSRADGRRIGIGFSSFVERTGYASARFLMKRGSKFGAHESLTLRANRSGFIDVYTGVSSIGQSAETAFAQVCADVLNVDIGIIRVHSGDTASTPLNTGAFASRTMIAAAGAIQEAGRIFGDKTLRIASAALDCPAEELMIEGAVVRHKQDSARAVPLADVFNRAIVGQGIPAAESPGLDATAHYEPPEAAFAFGTAAAQVAVDPVTGEFEIERFVLVHDCGTVINPMLVEGQVRGAFMQGFGAALGEELRYDDETGQLLNGTMMDYFAPTAADAPPLELLHTEIPSPVTPFGVRGVGEVGTIAPAAAIVNAVCDALSEFNVEISELPVTPEAVWRAMQSPRF
ncbi:MAG: xanthine dehydrogenase family protein molybdopterin-binding subunit [Alcaligenes sp.]